MDTREIEALTSALAPVLRGFVTSSLAPILDRLAAAESRAPLKGDPGLPGENGKDADQAEIAALKATLAEQREVIGFLMLKVAEPGPAGATGPAGKDADSSALEAVQAEVLELRAVIAELKATPALPGPVGPQGEPGAPGAPGQDGKSIEGPEGKPGRDGRDGLAGIQGEKGRDGIDGKNGADGVHGKDGFSVDELTATFEDERTLVIGFARGDERKELARTKFGHPLDQGVWKPNAEYVTGDSVSFGGSTFIAQRDTKTKPESPDSDWRLAVKRGRDGKDGVLVPAKPREPVSLR